MSRDAKQKEFLDHIHNMVEYWDKVEPNKERALEGLAFSILSALDGCACALPGYALIPLVEHEHFNELEKLTRSGKMVDIADDLHDNFYK